MGKQFGRNIVRTFDDFELLFKAPFHLSFQSHNRKDWRAALMHTNHHVVAWLECKKDRWSWSWKNPDNEKNLVVLPEDTLEFLNSPVALQALKQFRVEELKRYIGYTSSYLTKLRKELNKTLPKNISKQKKHLTKLRKQLNSLD